MNFDAAVTSGVRSANIENMRKPMLRVLAYVLSFAVLYGQSIKTGPEVGHPVPVFSAQDQDGRTQTLKSIVGRNGAMLVFFRSADW
jgi:hypothetical protein